MFELDRVFGGIAWLMVSVGTFIVAIGYLGVVDDQSQSSFRMAGYGIVMYAIGAIFVALNRFTRTPKH